VNIKIYTKAKALLLGAVFGLPLSVGVVEAQGRLNMSCSFLQTVCDQVKAKFEADTGIVVSMFRIPTGEAFARIRAEARNPKIDIWYGGTAEPHMQAADENLTQVYKSPNLDHVHDWAYKVAESSGFKMSALEASVVGFTWNTRLTSEKNLPEPKCWADLLKEEYKQEISISNPNTAGTGYFILANLVNLMGEEEAFDYLRKLNVNIASYSKSGSTAGAQAARGETAIGITFLNDAMLLMKQGFPLKVTAPCEGVGLSMGGVSIIEGAKNLDEAKKFIDWVLSSEGQSFVHSLGFYSQPAARGATTPEGAINPADYHIVDLDLKFYGSAERRKKLLARWDREIGAIAGQ